MRRTRAWILSPLLLAACASPTTDTLAELRRVEPDMSEVQIDHGLDQAMIGYQKFLEEAPESALTPEAMRRLADLKLEKQFGILGDGEVLLELPAPKKSTEPVAAAEVGGTEPASIGQLAPPSESERDFETRAASAEAALPTQTGSELELPGGEEVAWSGPLEAIELYDQLLATYPHYESNDQVLYQKARAYDELGRNDEAITVIERLISEYPHSRYIDEVQFRRAEYFFVRRNYFEAEHGYAAITTKGAGSDYYELALYKLGWSLYKQEMHEEALNEYITLLDYKVSTGYDFDQASDEGSGRRVADTYRVISLSFSSLGGPEAVETYFVANGPRSYEDRIYRHLGEFYFEKLRYADAAGAYEAFVALRPLHRSAPHFGMRVVEIYDAGGFPILVLESKKQFAQSYGLKAEYWLHFDVSEAPEVLSFVKQNLENLANHYHALYQEPTLEEQRSENFGEALHWYRAYLESFPADPQAPAVNYQLADLLLEHEDFGEAAREYERSAYDYPAHEKADAAGYAAIFAHREHQKVAEEQEKEIVRRDAVTSTLRFVEVFPEHEHAAVVMGAAVDDLYQMKELERAIATGLRLLEAYPESELVIRRAAWAAVAHAYFDLERYAQAEQAYAEVLAMTALEHESRQGFTDNFAASIYKQGEEASLASEHRAAADHFLRIKALAPSSEIRPAAEYDAGAALVRLEAWAEAAEVLDAFRADHPGHELNREATKQIASVRRSEGKLSQAAEEYERVAAESDDAELRREAMLLAGDLYEQSESPDRALVVYLAYVDAFPKPLETVVETRHRIAEIHRAAKDEKAHRRELRRIVAIDAKAGEQRTDRIRFLAAQSALLLTEDLYERFAQIELTQPFERSLKKKQRRMDKALKGFGKLVDYEVGEVTAAATFYMAEIYSNFSQALLSSERPGDLEPAELLDYEMVLEEEAFPFEEKAIEVHEKNLELMGAGIYNRWIDQSLVKLATLMPGRYAKFEASSGLIASIDRYAYHAPRAAVAEPAAPRSELESGADESVLPPASAPEVEPAAIAVEAS